MNKYFKVHIAPIFLIFLLLATACQQRQTLPLPTNTAPTTTSTPANNTVPENTQTPSMTSTITPNTFLNKTITATITPTNRWEDRALELTPIQIVDAQISEENVSNLQEIAVWGTGKANQLLLSPDGILLAVGTNIGVYLYDSLTFELLLVLPSRNAVRTIAFANDHPWIALGESDGVFEVFDYVQVLPMATLKLPQTFQALPEDFNLAFSEDDENLISVVTTHDDYQITRWASSDWRPIAFFSIEKDLAAYINPEIDLLGIANNDELRLQSLSHPDEYHTVPLASAVSDVLWQQIARFKPEIVPSREGNFILVNIGNAVVHWQINDEQVSYRLDEYPATLPNPCKRAPYTCLNTQGDFSWDCSDAPEIPPIEMIALSPDEVMLLISLNEGGTEFRRVADNLLAWKIKETFLEVTFSPGSEFFIGLRPDGVIEKRKTLNGELMIALERHPSRLYDLTFSPDGTILAAGFNDGYIRVYDVFNGYMLGALTGQAFSLDFSPNGELLAAGLDDGALRVFRLNSGYYYDIEPGHLAAVTDLSFSSDGKQLLTGSQDCTVSLWDLQDRYRVMNIIPDAGNPFRILDVEFSDENLLKIISGEGNDIFLVDSSGQIELLLSSEFNITDLSFSSDDQVLGTAGVQSWIIPNPERTPAMNTLLLNPDPDFQGYALTFTLDGSVLALATHQDLEFWSVSNGIFITKLSLYETIPPSGRPMDVETSPDGTIIAVGTEDGLIHIFSIP